MIAEMRTKVPGPKGRLVDSEALVFSDRMEGTNIWDLDDNRFLDLTSGGGLLPFGFVDQGTVSLSQLEADFCGYRCKVLEPDFLSLKRVLVLGDAMTTAFSPVVESKGMQLFELAQIKEPEVDWLVVKTQYLDDLSLRRVVSWCSQLGIKWIADERDLGMFRAGQPFVSSDYQPDAILTSIAGAGMQATSLLFSRDASTEESVDSLQVASNYADKDLARTNRLQAAELNGLLKDSLSNRQILCVGAYHSIQLESVREVELARAALLQRGVIVASLHDRLVLLPSLYLALGEIIFAVHHIRLVVDGINEVSLPWMSDQLREEY